MHGDFIQAGAELVGINVSSTTSHRAWKEKMGLNFPLLSDNGAKIARTYDVMSPDDSIRKGYSARAIFIVDLDRTIRYRWAPLDLKVMSWILPCCPRPSGTPCLGA
jgi:peroxiredoxin